MQTLVYILLIAVLVQFLQAQIPEVNLSTGRVRGTEVSSSNGKKINAYFGIPFAEPPTGKGRFKPPEAVRKWPETLEATTKAPACWQELDNTFPGFSGSEMWNAKSMSEDCLKLNIWTPSDAQKVPVLVWIFGGGFFSGSPSLDIYDGTELAAYGDVVVVNINYRLHSFGFLFLNTTSAPGNMGLLDQQIALLWVHDNIQAFGGDPEQVTIFGESAGSASVSAHLVAPESRNLFKYAVLQSGVMGNPWGCNPPEKAKLNSQVLAKNLNCSADGDPEKMIACLQALSPEVLSPAWFNVPTRVLEFPLDPVCADNSFFKSDVRMATRKGNLKSTNLIIGLMQNEGSFWLPYYLPQFFDNKATNPVLNLQQYSESIKLLLADYMTADKIADVSEHYSQDCDTNDGVCLRDAVNDMVMDFWFACDVIGFVDDFRNYADEAQVFLYNIAARVSSNAWPKWMGAMHAYEIEFIFGIPFRDPARYSDQDRNISEQLMRFWTTFAKTGQPSSDLSWPPVSSKTGNKYLEIPPSGVNATIKMDLLKDKCDFWRHLHDGQISQDIEIPKFILRTG